MASVITPKRRRSLRTYPRRDSSSVRSARSTSTLKMTTSTKSTSVKSAPVSKVTPKFSGDITTPLTKSPRARDRAAAATTTTSPKSQTRSAAANRRIQHVANSRSRKPATKKSGSKSRIADCAIYDFLALSESTGLHITDLELSMHANSTTRTHQPDFSETDDIVGWRFDPSTKSVLLITHRASDLYETNRLVPESLIQHKSPEKLYNYWASFGQPRQVTVGSDFYHILNILAHDADSMLKIQWVGYPPSDAETTWEPAAKVRRMNPVLLVDYITRHDPKREIKASLKRS
ncbi:hypothetical protein K4K60_005890 [Colletotrichum sp. SAR11_57]|nr:hypothetical protein K4K60_005890 [Colletotrichum sp. SAR11_57]